MRAVRRYAWSIALALLALAVAWGHFHPRPLEPGDRVLYSVPCSQTMADPNLVPATKHLLCELNSPGAIVTDNAPFEDPPTENVYPTPACCWETAGPTPRPGPTYPLTP